MCLALIKWFWPVTPGWAKKTLKSLHIAPRCETKWKWSFHWPGAVNHGLSDTLCERVYSLWVSLLAVIRLHYPNRRPSRTAWTVGIAEVLLLACSVTPTIERLNDLKRKARRVDSAVSKISIIRQMDQTFFLVATIMNFVFLFKEVTQTECDFKALPLVSERFWIYLMRTERIWALWVHFWAKCLLICPTESLWSQHKCTLHWLAQTHWKFFKCKLQSTDWWPHAADYRTRVPRVNDFRDRQLIGRGRVRITLNT